MEVASTLVHELAHLLNRRAIGPGEASFRLSSAYVDKRETTFQIAGTAQDTAGQLGSPHWKHFVQLGYTMGRFNGLIDWRWYQHSKINNQRIEGFAGVRGASIDFDLTQNAGRARLAMRVRSSSGRARN